MLPKDINQDPENNNINIASFGYYDGINVAKEKGLQQTTSFNDVFKGTHFIVCCGDVMMKVEQNDYPEIERRII
jgi:hypothetical protein